MKSIIPWSVSCLEEKKRFAAAGLKSLYSGKVRETFGLPGHPDLLLFYATDRISIFDIVLDALVPGKGYVLTAMTVMWLTTVFRDVPHHMVAYGEDIDEFLPEQLRGDVDLQKRCMVVRKADVLKVEAIVRGHITGSGYVDYIETGMVCGHVLPTGLRDGDELAQAIFTPSTKADQGEHDENISFEKAVEIVGLEKAELMRELALKLYLKAKKHASEQGIIIADTKFEFGIDKDGNILLIDEALTPDSSRFWDMTAWQIAQEAGEAPQGFDKQFFREWGKKVGIKKNPTLVPPQEVIDKTVELYMKGARIMLKKPLEEFQSEDMGIAS